MHACMHTTRYTLLHVTKTFFHNMNIYLPASQLLPLRTSNKTSVHLLYIIYHAYETRKANYYPEQNIQQHPFLNDCKRKKYNYKTKTKTKTKMKLGNKMR